MIFGKIPFRICVLILLLSLCWRILGAPLNRQDFQNLKNPLRQARLLLPQRTERLLSLWIYSEISAMEKTITKDQRDFDNQVLRVYHLQSDSLVQMSMKDYLRGVVAAEMPVQYHLEALKAQCLAARTRVLWQMEQGGCNRYPGADICTDSEHCQGYVTKKECLDKWGASYETYLERIVKVQQETNGQWIAYEGKPIVALYHAISGGKTENAQMDFSLRLPYLVSVQSVGEENVLGFQETTVYSFREIAERLNRMYGDMNWTERDIQQSFCIDGYTESGRVRCVKIGDFRIEAENLRKALDLRSTMFSVSVSQQGITFYQRGYGHGVGMSQAGANAMAARGSDFEDILQHYYQGTEIIIE